LTEEEEVAVNVTSTKAYTGQERMPSGTIATSISKLVCGHLTTQIDSPFP